MATSRIKTSSILQGFPKSRSLLAGNAGYDPAATWLIQRVAGTGSSGTITFSSIPQTYKHLQIRYQVFNTGSNTDYNDIRLRFNSDSGSNYARHELQGSDNTVSAFGVASTQQIFAGISNYGTSTTNPMVGIIDIHDYQSSTKNKTVRILSGVDRNALTGSGITLRSGLWMNTAAITSIDLILTGNSYTTTSTIALYGMVG